MSYEHILVDRDGPVGRLTLNRPDKLNAFAGRMRDEVKEALQELDTPDVRVVVITGAGRGFCSGADIGYLSELLARNKQNISRSAREAGIERAYLQRLVRKHGMRDVD